MTPELRAAIDDLRRFIAAEQAEGTTDDTPIIDGVNTLTIGHLRVLLAAFDPAEQPVQCTHCGDSPPINHTCPACGATTLEEAEQ